MNLSNDSQNSAYDGAGRLNHTIWRSKKFRGLQVDAKLALVYLIAGPEFSPSGIFTVDLASIGAAIYSTGGLAFLHNQGERVTRLLVDSGLIHYSAPTCWIPGVREFYLQSDIPGIKDVIDRDVAKVLPGPVLDAYKAEYELGDSFSRQHTDMTLALYDVMNLDATLDHPAIESFAYDLAKTYTHEEITLWYGSDGWWYKNDWRGKRGNYPNIASIRDTVKKASDGWQSRSVSSIDKNSVVETVWILQRQNASRLGASEMLRELWGPTVADKIMAAKRWGDWLHMDKESTKFAVYGVLRE